MLRQRAGEGGRERGREKCSGGWRGREGDDETGEGGRERGREKEREEIAEGEREMMRQRAGEGMRERGREKEREEWKGREKGG